MGNDDVWPHRGAVSRIGTAGGPLRSARPWLQALLIGAVLAATRGVCAADVGTDAGERLSITSSSSSTVTQRPVSTELPVVPTAAVAFAIGAAAARRLETSSPRQSLAEKAPGRMGMHAVLRVAFVEVVSHPESGSLNVTLRSRLLGRPVAHAPLAFGVAWRF